MTITKDLFNLALKYFGKKTDRMRFRGYRIQVIVVVSTTGEEPKLLITRSGFGSVWSFPQEGVEPNETFDAAAIRCLVEECGYNKDTKNKLHLRNISFLGSVNLPERRWGERSVVQDAAGGLYDNVVMDKKAYWVARYFVSESSISLFSPDNIEVLELEWAKKGDAIERIRGSVDPSKAEMLIASL